MCGIAGIVSADQGAGLNNRVQKMIDVIEHRGPDYGEIFHEDNVCLGHRRLKIIDLSDEANQPFWSSDKRYGIVYNGEIYNYQPIREELKEKGYNFRTGSDTEVLLNAYIEFGEECLEKLNGIFAFCIWDQQEKTLFGARDHIGVKPFYYYHDRAGFTFSSEIKAIIEAGIKAEPFYEAFPETVQFGFVAGENTFFKNVKRLLPGHCFTLKNNDLNIREYYSNIPSTTSGASYEEATQMVREKLDKAIEMQMVSDVPVGTMCSGGVDSSFITARSAKVQPDTTAYCVKIPFEGYDEEKYAQIAADHASVDLTVLTFNLDDSFDVLPTLIWLHDEPLRHPNSIPIFQISDRAKRDVTVLLSGEGSDEIFAGYGSYRAISRLEKLNKIPRSANALLKTASKLTGKGRELVIAHGRKDKADKLIHLRSFLNEKETNKLFTKYKVDSSQRKKWMEECLAAAGEDHINALLYYDQKTHMMTLLDRQDKMGMGTSIESRVPFLDHELVSMVNSLPSKFKLAESTKKIFREIAREVLPSSIFNRPKYPFAVPILRFYLETEKGRSYIENELPKSFLFRQDVLNQKQFDRYLQQFKKGSEYYAELIWNVVNIDLWYKLFITKEISPNREYLSYLKLKQDLTVK